MLPPEPADRPQQLVLIEVALDNVGGGASGGAPPAVLGRSPRRHQDRRGVPEARIGARPLHEGEAIHARHLHVDEVEAVTPARRLLEPLLGRGGDVDRVARGLEDALLQHARGQRVVDDEQRGARPERLDALGPDSPARGSHDGLGIEHELRVARGVEGGRRHDGIHGGQGRERPQHEALGTEQAVDRQGHGEAAGREYDRRLSARGPLPRGARAPEQARELHEGDGLVLVHDRGAVRGLRHVALVDAEGPAHRVDGDGRADATGLDDEGVERRDRDGHLDLEGRASGSLGADPHLAAQPQGGLAHDVQPDPAPRKLRDRARRGDAPLQENAEQLLLVESLHLGGAQTALPHHAAHPLEIDAAPVVAAHEERPPPLPRHDQLQGPRGRLARSDPLALRLHTVGDGVPHELEEGRVEDAEHVRIEAHLAAPRGERHPLARRLRDVARRALERREHGAGLHQLQLRRPLPGEAQLARGAVERPLEGALQVHQDRPQLVEARSRGVGQVRLPRGDLGHRALRQSPRADEGLRHRAQPVEGDLGLREALEERVHLGDVGARGGGLWRRPGPGGAGRRRKARTLLAGRAIQGRDLRRHGVEQRQRGVGPVALEGRKLLAERHQDVLDGVRELR